MEKAPAKSIKLVDYPLLQKLKFREPNTLLFKWFGEDNKIPPNRERRCATKSIFGDNWANDINIKDSLDEANLQVSLEITYFRKTNDSGQAVIDSIATSLRHLDEDDISIKLQGGGK